MRSKLSQVYLAVLLEMVKAILAPVISTHPAHCRTCRDGEHSLSQRTQITNSTPISTPKELKSPLDKCLVTVQVISYRAVMAPTDTRRDISGAATWI
jgi:hypothetical protein